jgi:hypothetical protein
VESATLLLAAKASVDIKDNDGWGPQPMSQHLSFGFHWIYHLRFPSSKFY